MTEKLPTGAQPEGKIPDAPPVMAADDVATIKRRMAEIRVEEDAWRAKTAA